MRPRSQRASILILLTVAIGCEDPGAPASCDPDNTLDAYFPFTKTREICFRDPNGDVLTYDVAISNPALADVALQGTTLTVTGKDEGETEITVTAMDPEGRVGTATYELTVRRAWDSGFNVCESRRGDRGVETVIESWIRANVDLAAIRVVRYRNGKQSGTGHHSRMIPDQVIITRVREFGPDREDIEIECSHVITARLVFTEL